MAPILSVSDSAKDPFHPTGEASWNQELERWAREVLAEKFVGCVRRGLKSEVAEGRAFEKLLRSSESDCPMASRKEAWGSQDGCAREPLHRGFKSLLGEL